MHRSEVHSKLVGIMRERLNASLKQLRACADQWAGDAPPLCGAPLPPPSAFAAGNAKQLRILSQVRSRHCAVESLTAVGNSVGLYDTLRPFICSCPEGGTIVCFSIAYQDATDFI